MNLALCQHMWSKIQVYKHKINAHLSTGTTIITIHISFNTKSNIIIVSPELNSDGNNNIFEFPPDVIEWMNDKISLINMTDDYGEFICFSLKFNKKSTTDCVCMKKGNIFQ